MLSESARFRKKREVSFQRRYFIGGSDARTIMGDDEDGPPPALAGEARRGRTGRPVRQYRCPAWPRDRESEPALVSGQYWTIGHRHSEAGPAPGAALDGGYPRRPC